MSSPRFDTDPLAAGRFGSQRRVRRGVGGSCMQAPDGVALRKPSCGNSKRRAGKNRSKVCVEIRLGFVNSCQCNLDDRDVEAAPKMVLFEKA